MLVYSFSGLFVIRNSFCLCVLVIFMCVVPALFAFLPVRMVLGCLCVFFLIGLALRGALALTLLITVNCCAPGLFFLCLLLPFVVRCVCEVASRLLVRPRLCHSHVACLLFAVWHVSLATLCVPICVFVSL